MQPEASTIGTGNDYVDQAKMIEKIYYKLPKNFSIIVKEHPAHMDLNHRSKFFYERLKNMKKVYFTNVNDNKDVLIKNCKAVVTVTGTAGWESLRNKKPVITFGLAWYNSLYNVYKWNSKINLEKICYRKFNLKKLNQSLTRLTRKMPEGVDSMDLSQATDFTSNFKTQKLNYSKEVKIIAHNLKKIVDSLK